MKKLIDIPDEIVKPLKRLAVEADRSLNAYIQEILIGVVREQKPPKT
jgi:hypothetical protein